MEKKILGFSLLELMVVVAILGVLATVAVPRFNIFRARARQAEAKSNLGVIFTLQESFAIEHEWYYDGDGTSGKTWGGTDMHNKANADGYQTAGQGVGAGGCAATANTNKLGFRLANCDKARYMYWVPEADEDQFLAIAYGLSDTTTGKRIFPGCEGTDLSRPSKAPGSTTTGQKCDDSFAGTNDATMPGSAVGYAWCLDQNRNLENYFDIVEGCDE